MSHSFDLVGLLDDTSRTINPRRSIYGTMWIKVA